MNKTKKTIVIINVIVTVLLLGVVTLLFNFNNSSKSGTITTDNNMTVVSLDNISYYDISTYGVDSGIYNESDYNRLSNIQIDTNNEKSYDNLTVNYTNNPIFKHFLNEKLVKKIFFGNDVCFITSKNDTQLLVKKDIVMPQLKTENISKIIIRTVDGKNILLEDNIEISEFIGEINYYLELLSENQNYQEYQVYYNNSDPNIYEVINSETLDYLT
ncbi:hypothetical protein [uncultured Eubacterium sp.]|uniref:hypothetical protein n=1 Tax=uncultured Eubacterium sp. TaxID=165185 RepID=UPI0025D9EC69|nr:hypothetical protein [uncultured Eubacterium sp.]